MTRLLAALALLVALLAVVVAGDKPLPRADLVYADLQPAFTLDPQRMSYEQDFRIAYALYEGLLRWDNDTFEPRPAAAESWTVSEDRRTYTFTLREGARWSSGDPVTAGDFVYAWRRAVLPDTAADYAQLFFFIEGAEDLFDYRSRQLERYAGRPAAERTAEAAAAARDELRDYAADRFGVTALGSRTLRVTLERPTPFFLDLLCFASFMPVHPPTVEAHVSLDPRSARLEQRHGWTKPGRHVGNGPYTLERWRFKRDMRLAKSQTYRDQSLARSDTIEIRTIENPETAVLAFETGAVDWLTDVSVDYLPDLVEAQREGRRDDVRWFPNFGTYFWNFNCTSTLTDGRPNPLADPRVRRAFAIAVDKEAIVENVRRVGEPVARALIPPGSLPGFDEEGEIGGLRHDPDAARAQLADAGWRDRDGDGVPESAAGDPFPVVELLCTSGSYHDQVAQAMQSMWERTLGVRSAIRIKETKTYRDDLKRRDYMMARGGWFGDYGDPTTFLALHRTGDGNNDRGYSDPRYDELYDRAIKEPDPAERYDLLEELERYTAEETVPVLPIFTYVQFYLADPSLEGFSFHPRKQQYLFELHLERGESDPAGTPRGIPPDAPRPPPARPAPPDRPRRLHHYLRARLAPAGLGRYQRRGPRAARRRPRGHGAPVQPRRPRRLLHRVPRPGLRRPLAHG